MNGFTLGYMNELFGKAKGPDESKSDFDWMMIALLALIFSGPKHNGDADYWRGKYDALKELSETSDDVEAAPG